MNEGFQHHPHRYDGW
jgi:hypothetical protein